MGEHAGSVTRKTFWAFVSLAAACCFTPGKHLSAAPVNWGTTANVASGGWGRMIPLGNGNWLAVSTVFPAGTNSYLSLLVSSDTCRTWTQIATVRESARTLDNG